MRTDHVLRRSLCLLFFAAIGLARSMSAQSMERGKQLFDNAKYAAAKTELLAVHKKDSQNAAAAYFLGRIATTIGDAAQRASSIRQPFMARRKQVGRRIWRASSTRRR